MTINAVLDVCSDIAELEVGGQKSVFSAVHPTYGDVVLKRGRYPHHGALERISREVGLLADIDSNYYPKHFGFVVEAKSGEFLIVEERIEGQPLNLCMEAFSDEVHIIRLLKSLIDGLDLLWQQRVVHRDIKPQNIIIRTDGSPVIIDLGIARLLDLSSLTMAGAALGPCTPAYASPEQLQNNKMIIGPRSDFFALGLLSLQLCLGFHPFDPERVGAGDSIQNNILQGQYVNADKVRGYSREFNNLIERLLQIEPHQRYRNKFVLSSYIDSNWRGIK